MKKITFVKAASVLLFTLVFVGQSWSQSALYRLSNDEQVRNSDAVIEGKVIAKSSYWDENKANIYTVNTIEVYKVFKGNPQPTVEIITSGGTVGTDMEIVSPSLNLQPNDIGLFFLNTNTKALNRAATNLSTYVSHSSIQGFYKYDLLNDRAINPANVVSGIESILYQELNKVTNRQYTEVKPFKVKDVKESMMRVNSRMPMAISGISPLETTAGTKSTVTITGSGFGSVKGDVGFSNSDYGGMLYHNALESQVLNWSDTEIVVEVPDKAGTGDIRITHEDTSTLISAQSLTVDYAHSNAEYTPPSESMEYAYFLQHVDDDGNGGYEWQMFTDFDANTDANAAFVRALETWRCNSKINWTVGATTPIDVIANDGVNVVRFDNGSELPSGVLGRCTSRFSGCFNGTGSVDWYVTELDIVFDDSANWNFNDGPPTTSQYDFESVTVHELGHGHQMGHVIDSNTVMHYSISNGSDKKDLSQNDIDGGSELQLRSTTNQVCGAALMTNFSCAALSTEDAVLSNGIRLYPNPASDYLYLNNTSNTSLKSIDIIDINGRLILSKDIESIYGENRISVRELTSGMYFFRISSENASTTKKIIIK